jgi:insertion element IS1 protein InsB
VWDRTTELRQDLVERSPQAAQYYSDNFATYHTLVSYPGHHAVAPRKSQTSSGEADNAEVRHYLARLGRRSRCFSRSIEALRRAVKLFVHGWNRRQLHKRAFPRYACHVMDVLARAGAWGHDAGQRRHARTLRSGASTPLLSHALTWA